MLHAVRPATQGFPSQVPARAHTAWVAVERTEAGRAKHVPSVLKVRAHLRSRGLERSSTLVTLETCTVVRLAGHGVSLSVHRLVTRGAHWQRKRWSSVGHHFYFCLGVCAPRLGVRWRRLRLACFSRRRRAQFELVDQQSLLPSSRPLRPQHLHFSQESLDRPRLGRQTHSHTNRGKIVMKSFMITVFGYARLLSFLGLGPDDRLPACAHIHACAPPRARPPSQGPQSRALSWLVGLVHGCKGVGDVVPASLGSELAAAADFVGLPSCTSGSWWNA